jgi:23S rRNA (adenine2030-N6)-methyltransferase
MARPRGRDVLVDAPVSASRKRSPLNYRHAFHAGNFADLVKHACLTACLARLTQGGPPLDVIDTHAGAGLYDLEGEAAAKSGEAALGVARLMADGAAPAQFDRLKTVTRNVNGAGRLKFYPGSSFLIAAGLRSNDRLTACELRPDDFALLGEALKGARAPNAQALRKDGFAVAALGPERAAKGAAVRRGLVLIDPPFERPDDYAQILRTLTAVLRRDRAATLMIWLPLKDLETFDRFLRDLETGGFPPALIAEARLRPLSDPMRMNGCVMVVLNDPPGLEADARAVCDWTVSALGEAGGEARVWRLD